MIIQTGMRTDIPAFYSNWFLKRINVNRAYENKLYALFLYACHGRLIQFAKVVEKTTEL